jgi:hypothetical protein
MPLRWWIGCRQPGVNWTRLNPKQKFWIWTEDEEIDLREVDLFVQSEYVIWQTLKASNPPLGGKAASQLYQGTRKVQWSELPLEGVTLVPYGLSAPDRDDSIKLMELRAAKPIGKAGHQVPSKNPSLQCLPDQTYKCHEIVTVIEEDRVTQSRLLI